MLTASTAWEMSSNSNFRKSKIMQEIYKAIEQACNKGIYCTSIVISSDNNLEGISKLLEEIGYKIEISSDPFNAEIKINWRNFITANKGLSLT